MYSQKGCGLFDPAQISPRQGPGAKDGDIARRCPRRRFPAFGRRNFEPPARRGQESAGRRTSQRAIPTTVAGGKDAANGRLGWTNDVLVGTLRCDVPAGAFPFWPAEFLPARRGQESAGRRTAQRAIPTTARRRKRQPGRARSPAMSQVVAVRKHRPMAGWGGRTRAIGVAWKNPKGISSISPALTRSGYAG